VLPTHISVRPTCVQPICASRRGGRVPQAHQRVAQARARNLPLALEEVSAFWRASGRVNGRRRLSPRESASDRAREIDRQTERCAPDAGRRTPAGQRTNDAVGSMPGAALAGPAADRRGARQGPRRVQPVRADVPLAGRPPVRR
jgi:hypothetical protein